MRPLSFALMSLSAIVALLSVVSNAASEVSDSSSFHKSYHSALDSPYLHTLNLFVDKKDEQCVYISSHKAKDRIMMNFQLIKGQADFDVVIKGHMREPLYIAKSGEHDGSDRVFFVSKDAGEFSLCVDARDYSDSIHVVRVTVAAESRRKAARVIDPLTQLLDKSEASLRTLVTEQSYIRGREITHRNTLESNNKRALIMWGSEFFVLLALSIGQVVYVRRLFSKKKEGRAA